MKGLFVKVLLPILLFTTIFFISASQVHAQLCDPSGNVKTANCNNLVLSPLFRLSCTGIDTAIGCIPIGTEDSLFGFILGWAIGIAGGVAFLLILYAGFMITTSSGDPKKLQAGRELLTSAIAGLLLLIFSVFILKLIGVDILGIPEFGG